MSRTITYEPIEEEEILFQPQGMTVEYVAKSNKEINNDECERLKSEISRLQRLSDAEKGYKPTPKKVVKEVVKEVEPKYTYDIRRGKLYRCEKFKGGRYYSIVEKHDKDRPTNFEILMMWCNL
jgi:hypothetical protein